ncbi:hypothetical protein FQN51_003321 [Onygenales sp. PD_10]|nr:hypothetical protein FQN51_003321 [Onygenales sp. PD_10]
MQGRRQTLISTQGNDASLVASGQDRQIAPRRQDQNPLPASTSNPIQHNTSPLLSNMAARRTRANISGPHSALTDFLASNNISAAEIRNNYEQRLRQARQQNEREQQQQQANEAEVDNDDEANQDEEMPDAAEESSSPRKRKSQAAMTKAKKAAKKKNDDARILNSIGNGGGVPGQLENCENCQRRFTVTTYTKTGTGGGLLCFGCSKRGDLQQQGGKPKQPPKNKRGRRQNVSRILDGIVQMGSSSLVESCIKKVADNINDVEEFGDLPPDLLMRLSHILSKRRALNPLTLDLFLRGDTTVIDIYDCGKLEQDDFQKMFATMPFLERVNLRFAGQLKDKPLEYMMDHNSHLKHLHLDATNLISNECWKKLFKKCGPMLESLKLSNLDSSLDDDAIETMTEHCTNLRRLKLKICWLPGDKALGSLAKLSKLEHLSLDFLKETSSEQLLEVIDKLGPNLKTLSLHGFKNADDQVLDMIHQRCSQLSKLRIADNCVCTDKAYARLFTEWNNPPLLFVDLSSTRDVDNRNPDGPEEPIGLAAEGFKALMGHSGKTLKRLDIGSCRHISHEALSSVFDGTRQYLHLKEIDISFHASVDDFLVLSLFRSCPALRKIIAFACFGIRDVQIPAGVALIGGLNAHHTSLQQDTMRVIDQMF